MLAIQTNKSFTDQLEVRCVRFDFIKMCLRPFQFHLYRLDLNDFGSLDFDLLPVLALSPTSLSPVLALVTEGEENSTEEGVAVPLSTCEERGPSSLSFLPLSPNKLRTPVHEGECSPILDRITSLFESLRGIWSLLLDIVWEI